MPSRHRTKPTLRERGLKPPKPSERTFEMLREHYAALDTEARRDPNHALVDNEWTDHQEYEKLRRSLTTR